MLAAPPQVSRPGSAAVAVSAAPLRSIRRGTRLRPVIIKVMSLATNLAVCAFALTLTRFAALLPAPPTPPAHADVSGAEVRRAIQRGVRAIRQRQQADGGWPEQYHRGGESCLAALALLQAGEPRDSNAITSAINHIRRLPNQMVYVVSLKLMVLTEADPARYRQDIEDGAKWLSEAQTNSGLWSYRIGGQFDHSNTQFALLGLDAAARAGVEVDRGVWARARNAILRTQNRDGGWGYRHNDRSYGSMTAAGVSNLLILGSVEEVSAEKTFVNGVAPGCGNYRADANLTRGLQWLGRSFRADANPERDNVYTFYWLYAVERCGILSGRQYFGRHDWYREGADFLVDVQRPDGNWTAELANTCFAVLFLAKGHKPLVVQKLQWSDRDDWNLDRHDLEHLVSRAGEAFGEPVAWQTLPFEAPLEEWLAAPLLYMQGHDFPRWDAAQVAKVKSYVERGGVLLAEACCGRDDFQQGFRQFAKQAFPQYALRALGKDHALYSAFHKLDKGDLEGIDVGCRTSVIFSPSDLSCLWEQGDVPELSERAFKLGTNIAAYAAGRHALRDRLDVVTLPEREGQTAAKTGGLDALRIGQVVHQGDWQPDPMALVRLSELLRDELAIDVVTQYAPVQPAPDELRRYPLLFLTGHYGLSLDPAQRRALADHLRRGGFLVAEACCGREAFDRSFRDLVRDLFPETELKPLPPDHVLFRGEPGFRIGSIAYRPAALAAEPDLHEPRLLGLEIDGRLVLVYSPYSLGCGWDGHECAECRGVMPEDARRLGANIVLYALTH